MVTAEQVTALLRSPQLLSEPSFPAEDYLRRFAWFVMVSLLGRIHGDIDAEAVRLAGDNRAASALSPAGLAVYAFDLGTPAVRVRAHEDHFVEQATRQEDATARSGWVARVVNVAVWFISVETGDGVPGQGEAASQRVVGTMLVRISHTGT